MRDLYLRVGDDGSDGVGGALRIIDYFDRLVAVRAGEETLVREAAALAGTPVGHRRGQIVWRSFPSGVLVGGDPGEVAEALPVGDNGEVWREVGDGATPLASLVLERLSLALSIGQAAGAGGAESVSPVDVLLSAPLDGENPDLRERAWSRLRLEPSGIFRAVAVPLDGAPPPGLPHALVDTPDGPLFGVIVREGSSWKSPAGVGPAVGPADLHRSWRAALVCLRLAEPGQTVTADSLGPLLPTLEAVAPGSRYDADRVAAVLDRGWSVAGLEAMIRGESVRAVARVENLHHSTVQTRMEQIADILGFAPHTAMGRTRLGMAFLVWRYHHPDPRPVRRPGTRRNPGR